MRHRHELALLFVAAAFLVAMNASLPGTGRHWFDTPTMMAAR
ncbi:hypothetical protein [Sagittula salina]|nr:hypothetical protein [Sagittula salina]